MSATDPIPLGLCQCGCGQPTTIATSNNAPRGLIKGRPNRFVHGHQNRIRVRYRSSDRGYETPCWIWLLAKDHNGRGVESSPTGLRVAHRVEYEKRYGKLPRELELHHLCEIRDCVNPEHLRPLTATAHRHEHSRFTWADVEEIRCLYAGGARIVDLAVQSGVTTTCISYIVHHKRWKTAA